MAGGSVPDAGEQVPCPRCGEVGYQKAMIPVLVGEGPGHELICVACARALRPDDIKAADPTPA
jgi:hypothetical protein